MLTTICLVHSDRYPHAEPFMVQIESTELVGTLKNQIYIKRPPLLAEELRLWKVSIPEDDELEAKLRIFD